MVVPNYVPDPLEIPGNVTQEPYLVRVGFVRRVAALHLVSLLLVFGVAAVAPATGGFGVGVLAALLLALLVGLSVVRATLRGSRLEIVVSTALLLPTLLVAGLLGRSLVNAGFPAWTVLTGALCAAVYALACGRDLSFVGQFVIALLASSVAIVGIEWARGASAGDMAAGLSLNACYLFFVVYDLASLLSRRRLGGEIGAVVDLYRDLLNFVGYLPRVVSHWRRHRIWELR